LVKINNKQNQVDSHNKQHYYDVCTNLNRKADFSKEISKQELFKFDGHMMGVVDVKFNLTGNCK